MAEDTTFAPYHPIEFTVRGPFCEGPTCGNHPDLAALQVKVTQVQGTADTVAVGERYVVSGEYELAGSDDFCIGLGVSTKAFGACAFLQPGSGRFDISGEILDLIEDPPNGLGIVFKNGTTGRCNIVRWVMLQA